MHRSKSLKHDSRGGFLHTNQGAAVRGISLTRAVIASAVTTCIQDLKQIKMERSKHLPPILSNLSTASIEMVVKSVAENETWPGKSLCTVDSAANRLMGKVETCSLKDIYSMMESARETKIKRKIERRDDDAEAEEEMEHLVARSVKSRYCPDVYDRMVPTSAAHGDQDSDVDVDADEDEGDYDGYDGLE